MTAANVLIQAPSTREPGQHVLSEPHLRMLREGSAISDEVITARGYRTVTDAKELRDLGFDPKQCHAPALVLPVHGTDGSNSLYVIRPDVPRSFDEKSKGRLPDGTYPQKVLKYEQPKGASMRLDCPPPCRPLLGDPSTPLWITEGQKKADSLASQGLCAIDVLGVWNWRGTNALGGLTALADWEEVALKERDIRIVFDSDVMRKAEVQHALKRLTVFLQHRGARVATVYLPHGDGGCKQGVDDFLAAGRTREDLDALVEAPRPLPTPSPLRVELLDAAPRNMSRPLALIDGRGYAATWLYAKVTQSESVSKSGELVRHDPPIVTTERRLFIVRDDGRIYGDGGDASLEELALEVHLPEVPPVDKLWSARGVKLYRANQRPDPRNVFARVTDTVDRFIDFNKSLADQRTMAEMVGCYILASYYLDAFNVIGFLWPNGDRGSGKTQLLTVACELGYLGQVILAGGSFASLRDLADYGAMLAFDDAENMSDPKSSDPDKRALLLAGNRRGNTVPVKESAGERQWRTRYVNTFCPRLFSATKLPDAILASRTIVVPLIRTPDRYRANADPLDYALWPHDRRQLLDDLWALGLSLLVELSGYEARVNKRARLAGRNLEPWRAILAVAMWLSDKGVAGLWDRIEALSVAYQEERVDLEIGDLTAVVIRALCRYADKADCAVNAETSERSFSFKTATITKEAKEVVDEIEADMDPDAVTSRRVGRVLGKMRLKPDRTSKAKGWRMSEGDLLGWLVAYGLPIPEALQQREPDTLNVNGTDGMAGITASPAELATEPSREVFEL
jgi:hypothetical protein